MKLIKSTLFAVVAATLALAPAAVRAAETNTPAATEAAPKKASLPYKGNVAAVDANAMTFTVGTMTLSVTSKTKITKDAKPATFADITVGESVTGSYKKDEGKLIASSVKIKEGKAKEPKKKEHTQQ